MPRCPLAATAFLIPALLSLPVSGQTPETIASASVLDAAERAGPRFTVDDRAAVTQFFYVFTLATDFGPMTAIGRSQLPTRAREVQALAALDDVSKTDVFIESAGGAMIDLGKSTVKAVTDPEETLKGVGAGVKRLGVNLGRIGKRTVTTKGGADTGESGAESAANTVLGVSSAMRRWAQKVGADPYTTNITLRNALKSIAQVDAAGSIATKIVLPVPMVVGQVATVSDLVWSKDPEELRKLNEGRVRDLPAAPDIASAFFRNGWYTLTMQTRIVAALSAVGAPGADECLRAAAAARSEREALFFVESAEMVQRFHEKTPVRRLLSDSRAAVAFADGTATLLVPVDRIDADRDVVSALGDIATRAKRELRATSLALHTTGRLTAPARAAAEKAGWTVTEGLPMR